MTVQLKRGVWIYLTLLHLFMPSVISTQCSSLRSIPNIGDEPYTSLGDINFGAFIMTTHSKDPLTCSNQLRGGTIHLELTEAVHFAVKRVNENPNLLPNITLGFVILNDCANGNVAMAKALQFLPRVRTFGSTAGDHCSCNSSNLPASSPGSVNQNQDHEMQYYDVVGVLSPMWSAPTVLLSQLFSTSRIPVLGCIATSDELSDKKSHPYFLRLVSPDRFQVEAMLSFIRDNGWSYISILYAYGSFGETGYDTFKQRAPHYGICIATGHRVNEKSNFDVIVEELLNHTNVRVVILFTYLEEIRSFFDTLDSHNARGRYIWIGGDGWGSAFRTEFSDYESHLWGAFWFSYKKAFEPALYQYMSTLRVNTSSNPWFKTSWEMLEGCSFDNGTCNHNSIILRNKDFTFTSSTSLYIDAVMAFAHALTNQISDTCPGATGAAARECIKGDVFLKYLKNLSFQGLSGTIQFDNTSDVRGQYEINQISWDYKNVPFPNVSSEKGLEPRPVAVYDIITEQIIFGGKNLSWDHLSLSVPDSSGVPQMPVSVCSLPCGPGEYKSRKELPCCWECRKCRENERLVDINSRCESCPIFTWPDATTNFTTCRLIEPTHPSMSDSVSVVQTCLGVGAILFVLMVGSGYIYYRDSRVIKAASKELSILQMVAVIVGYLAVILFQLPPTHGICCTLYYLFCLSFAWLYAPLIVKALRVYRIFLSDAKHNRRPRFVSPRSQVVMTAMLISVQVVICVIVHIIYKPTARTTHPVLTEKFVELSCDMTLPGLASFLAYNLVLVLLCSFFAFKTRQLPDNFNESWFMFMCVSTTLVIWLAFVPTYFTASRESVKTLLLSVALLLNHTVAVVFLFLPKIYAAAYLPSDNSIATTRFHTSNVPRTLTTTMNRVTPASSSHPVTN